MNTFEYIIKKYNINVGHQYVIEIPNMGSPELAELFTELKFNVGAEIGVWQGEFSEILCKANPKLHLYSIDSWDISVYEKGFLEQSPAQQSNHILKTFTTKQLKDSRHITAQLFEKRRWMQ